MDKVLKWSLDPTKNPPKELSKLFYDEAKLMVEYIEIAKHGPEKKEAMEQFHFLVENIDNANNIQNLKLWSDIILLLNSDDDNDLIAETLWMCGTAVQNNKRSQDNLIAANGISSILEACKKWNGDDLVVAKGISALNSLISNNSDGIQQFIRLNGVSFIVDSLQLKKAGEKAAFFLKTQKKGGP